MVIAVAAHGAADCAKRVGKGPAKPVGGIIALVLRAAAAAGSEGPLAICAQCQSPGDRGRIGADAACVEGAAERRVGGVLAESAVARQQEAVGRGVSAR